MKITNELVMAENIMNIFIDRFRFRTDFQLERFHVYTNVEKEKDMFTNVLQLVVSKGKSSVMIIVPYSNNERWLKIYDPSRDETVKHEKRGGNWAEVDNDHSELTYEDIFEKVCAILNK